MQLIRHYTCFLAIVIFCLSLQTVKAQLGFELDIKKPEPFEDRKLRAERTGEKKFTVPRRLMQGLTTHYNYFFNASTKLNEIIDRAKQVQQDDYGQLLSFYNYSLEATKQEEAELDSVIHKAKTGIVLHDLRNDWIDDLYLLWGASYYLQQHFDSAYQMFQFINYAFAEKEDDGYYKYIGSRMDGNSAISIATKEDMSLARRIISDPPSRNNAFIWQVRTLIQQNAMPEAGSLIATLKNDPNFPERLRSSLHEVQAFWFYKQQMWDSSATYLVKALDVAATQQEKARWEYLAAQMFERANRMDQAETYYSRSIKHTTDPILDIYARLNLIRVNKAEGKKYIEENIAALLKMAKRDKYEDYRTVIYSMAAQMELERGNFAKAHEYLLQGSKYRTSNISVGNNAFLQLADLSFAQKNYIQAASFYDSVRIEGMPISEAEKINTRREILSRVVAYENTIARQDSLQRIATLPEEERNNAVRRMVRQLRRQQGLKDEEITGTRTVTADPFNDNRTKGEWYFYNPLLKTQGVATFKQVWGDRPNVDNWRRFSNVTAELRNNSPKNTRGTPPTLVDITISPSYDALLSLLPLTPESLQISNDSIKAALFNLGNVYVNELEDYQSAIEALEALNYRYAPPPDGDLVFFNLNYSYSRIGNIQKAEEAKKALLSKYPTSRYAGILASGKDPSSNKPSAEVTNTYERIYDQFLEGNFTAAKTAKYRADSMYKTNYWSPQLLYIEAVYHIQQREDSVAKQILNTIIQQDPDAPMAGKAQNMVQVLDRRTEIEEELRTLQIERPAEEVIVQRNIYRKQDIKRDTAKKQPQLVINKPVAKQSLDTAVRRPVAAAPMFTFNSEAPHYVVVVLNKVDVVFGNEARNAFNRYNREKYGSQPPLPTRVEDLDPENKLLLVGPFINALAAVEYVDKAKPVAGPQIVPWLKAERYSFTIVSEANLEALKNNSNLLQYRNFLQQYLPGKF